MTRKRTPSAAHRLQPDPSPVAPVAESSSEPEPEPEPEQLPSWLADRQPDPEQHRPT